MKKFMAVVVIALSVVVTAVLTYLIWLFFVPLSPKKLQYVQETLRQRLRIFVDILDQHGYDYFLEGGSLLGCIREGGIIPHDDDVDISMLQTDLDRLMNDKTVAYELKQHGLILKKQHPCYKLVCIKCSDKVFIDIFGYDKTSDGRLVFHRERNRIMWPNNWFYIHEVYPLRSVMFEQFEVKVPQNAIPYLKRQYGDTWHIPKKRLITHKFWLI